MHFAPSDQPAYRMTVAKKGYVKYLLRKCCSCSSEFIPTSCPRVCKPVFAGSRFTVPGKTRYSPSESEFLAITWALDNAKLFVLGCPNLTIITNHNTLLAVITSKDLLSMNNSGLCNIKEKTFQYKFSVEHCLGK